MRSAWQNDVPLTVKLLAPTLLSVIVAWILFDYVQTNRTNASFRDYLLQSLHQNAKENRSKLDGYLVEQDQAARLFVQMEAFQDYIHLQEQGFWSAKNPPRTIKHYREKPP